MKKTISINLQGIIFHVEDDGYALLNNYLTSVKAYFSTFDGHEEIMADIESRIAEIFLTRQNPGKQIVTLEDVQYLIARMGSVADFAAQAEEEEAAYNQQQQQTYSHTSGGTFTNDPYAKPGQKRLYLDESRKKLAGVCAGIGHYMGVDPLWVRLLFVLFVIGSPITAGSTAGIAIVTYIVLWMVLPVSASLPDAGVKKLYRDPDDKKLAGVSSGIGHYFGVEPIWIRLIFVLLVLFFGTGFLAYIILWIIMPEATTNSEKAEMRGNPVTLSSIEASIRNNTAFKDGHGQENAFAKLLLLPIRLLAQVLEVAGPALKAIFLFLFAFIRIVAGILLVMLGLSGITFAVCILFLGFGNDASSFMLETDMQPLGMIVQEVPWYGVISAFLLAFLPGLFFTIMGLSLMAKRSLLRQPIGWTMVGLFIVSAVVFGISLGLYLNQFKRTATFTEQITFQRPQNRPLQLLLTNHDGWEYEDLDLIIAPGTDSSAVLLSAEYEGKGLNQKEAERAARMLNLPVKQTDSALVFSPHLTFKPGAVFRSQDMELTLRIPQGQTFTMDEDLAGIISFTKAGDGFYTRELANQTLVFEAGKLRCLTCTSDDSARMNRPAEMHIPAGAKTERYSFGGFRTVEAAGNVKLVITRSSEFEVVAYGPKNGLSRLDIKEEGGQLKIETNTNLFDMADEEPVTIQISMPDLQHIVLAGAVKGSVIGFDTDRFEASLVGASELEMDIRARELKTDLIGASTLTVTGTVETLEAQIVGASELDALGLQTKTADVEAAGASKARLQVTNQLKAEANGASSIRYSGNPQSVDQNVSGAATIEATDRKKSGKSWE